MPLVYVVCSLKKKEVGENSTSVLSYILPEYFSCIFLLHWNQTEVKAPASGPLFMGKKLVVFSWSHTWRALSFPWGLHYLQSQCMKLNSLTFWFTEWTCHSGQGGCSSLPLQALIWNTDYGHVIGPKHQSLQMRNMGSKGPGFQDSNPDFDIYWLWPWASDMTYLSCMGWC